MLYYIMSLNHKYLCITSSLYIASLYYFILFSPYSHTECILAYLLLHVLIISQLFWYNPIQYSLLHRVDAIIAKITIMCFFIYTLKKNKNLIILLIYLLIFLMLILLSLLSEYYSQKQWLSVNHILSHGLLHIVGLLGSFFAFIPM